MNDKTNKQIMSNVDEYGFEKTKEENEIKSKYYEVLTKRSLRWNKVFPGQIIAGRRLNRFIRKGIPLNLRKKIWMKISGAQRAFEHNMNLYQHLLKSQYQKEIVEVVKIDIPRTFPENIYFETHHRALFNVLVAFAHQNKSIGYCQGLNYIGGLILIVTKDENATFWLLKHLIENVASEYHTKTMFGLQRDIFVITEIIKMREPLINEKINEIGLPWAVILTKWLICLFAEVLPVETVLRIWDVMFAEGYKVIFRTAIAIILILKEDIMKTSDITELNELFRNVFTDPRMVNCHSFLQFMFTIKLRRRDIEDLRIRYSQ
ncbi:CLUMA_CG011175, isoform A [Clunio marinus]|uniref:CLUMA_CG011175, isoform A n=1 Tax=Clunio marinus TaxID=568069 RepID=A0A1J1IE15_9DIPT|nr:CLUMA_CG011175, isoform A [Clunio marinus]